MGRSRRGKTRFECGHRGFGKACRRCLDADKMEAKAKRLRKATAKRWELLKEAARLRSLDGELPKEFWKKWDEDPGAGRLRDDGTVGADYPAPIQIPDELR